MRQILLFDKNVHLVVSSPSHLMSTILNLSQNLDVCCFLCGVLLCNKIPVRNQGVMNDMLLLIRKLEGNCKQLFRAGVGEPFWLREP